MGDAGVMLVLPFANWTWRLSKMFSTFAYNTARSETRYR
jgi:hypothetical protein